MRMSVRGSQQCKGSGWRVAQCKGGCTGILEPLHLLFQGTIAEGIYFRVPRGHLKDLGPANISSNVQRPHSHSPQLRSHLSEPARPPCAHPGNAQLLVDECSTK